MKMRMVLGLVVVWMVLYTGSVWGYTETESNNFFGIGAGSNNTGASNTFIGGDAGISNDEGSDNSFLGADAGYSNTGGYCNTFVGSWAGFSNTAGNYNSFLGCEAGSHNVAGNANSFLGSAAGMYNQGNENSFVGYQAGFLNTTGAYDSFFGSNAGYHNTTGSNNSFLGQSAGYSNTTGSNNSFLGYWAGYLNTTGNYNNFLGYRAGYLNMIGNDNTFLGAWAGYSDTTGSGNVFLGYSAGYNETGSNKLYIANSNTSSPLIYGDFGSSIVTINGNLGVGKTPSTALDVNGTVNATSFTGNGSGLTNLNELDPKVGTLTAGRWCSSSDGSHVTCTQNTPVIVEVDPKVGTLNSGQWCTSDGTKVNCSQSPPVTVDKVGTLTTGQWCSSPDGSHVTCTQSPPVTTDKVGANTLNSVPRWNGSQLVSGIIQDNGSNVTVNGDFNVVAPDSGLIHLTDVMTDQTEKIGGLVVNHYLNTQLPVSLVGAISTNTGNSVAIGGGDSYGNAATQIDFYTAPNYTTAVGTSRMTIASNGNVGIGTSTPTGPLSIVSSSYGNLLTITTTSAIGGAGFSFAVPTGGNWYFKATQDNGFKIRDAAHSKDVMYLQYATGNVGIGTSAPAYLLDVAGPIRVQSTVYTSSRALKDSITDLGTSEALEALKLINPVKFHYKTDPGTAHIGFIAEDVPNLVAQKNRDAIDPMDIVAVLTKVVQEQQKANQEQQVLIKTLAEKLAQLEAEMKDLRQSNGNPMRILSQR